MANWPRPNNVIGNPPSYPAIYGANGGPNPSQNRGPRTQELFGLLTGTLSPNVGYANPSVAPSGQNSLWVAAGDFNGDGVDEAVAVNKLAATNAQTSEVTVYFATTFNGLRLDGTGITSSTAAPTVLQSLPGGRTGFSVSAGDLTGDGRADFVVATDTDQSVVIYKSTSTTSAISFATPVVVTGLGANSKYITIADANGDHKPDLVIATGSDTVVILLNDGAGNFSTAAGRMITIVGSTNMVSAAVADFTHDGLPDVATVSGSGLVSIWPGTGSNTFSANPINISANVENAVWVSAADMNGDGLPDLVVASQGDAKVAVMLNSTSIAVPGPSSLTFYAAVNGSNPPSQTVQLTGNATYTSSVNTFGTGNWLSPGSSTSGPVTVSVNVAGLASKVFRGVVNLTLNDTDGNFNVTQIFVTLNVAAPSGTLTYTPGAAITGVNGVLAAIGDFNGDGKPDALLYSSNNNQPTCPGSGPPALFLYAGNGNGTFSSTPTGTCLQFTFANPALGFATFFTAGDFNGDGNMDIAWASDTAFQIAFGDGAGHFLWYPATFFIPNGSSGRIMRAADLNNDGFPDIVYVNGDGLNHGHVVVFLNDGTGKNFFATDYAVGDSPFGLAIGDFDSDGLLDIAVANLNSNNGSFLKGAGGGFLNAASTIVTCNAPLSVIPGDFNRDGKLDLIFGCNNQSNFSVMLGNGNGTFQAGTLVPTGGGIAANLALGDFDGDGIVDLVYSKSGQPSISVQLGNGSGGFPANATDFTADSTTTPQTLTPIDISLEGRLDVFYTRNSTTAMALGDLATTNVTLSSTPADTAPVGQSVAFTATVGFPLNSPAWAKPGGVASISDTTLSATVGQGNVSGTPAVFTVNAALASGAHTLTCSYAGDSRTKPSNCTSNYPFSVTGTASATKLAVTGFPSPTAAGVQHSFTVTAQDGSNNTVTSYTGTVHFTSSDGQAVLPANYTFVAGDNGVHTFNATLKTVGTQSITATDTTTSITGTQSSITVQAGASTNVNPSGTPQSVVVAHGYSPISVTVTDSLANPVSGASVTFQAPASGASVAFQGGLTSQTVTTNASGVATPATPLANATAGAFTVTATVNSIVANFSLTNLPDVPAFMNVTGGDNQSTAVNTAFPNPLKAQVFDQFENVVPGAAVTFTAPGTGPSGKFPSNSLTAVVNTDSTGTATSPTFTANGTAGGPYQVTASTPGVPIVPSSTSPAGATPASRGRVRLRPAGQTPRVAVQQFVTASFNLTNLAIPTMTIVAGNNQSATVGTAFATALAVQLKDQDQNPAVGVSVTFTPPSNGASGAFSAPVTVTTNGAGIATASVYTANTIAGGNAPRATATLNSTALSVTFSLTNTPGAAATMTPSGTPQNAVISTAYATPLSVKIADQFGNGISSQSVLFTAPSSGASGTFPSASVTATVITDANGNAAAPTFTANATLGAFTVRATSGSLSANFSLTNIINSVGITAISGSGQTTGPGSTFGLPLVARVFDANGNGVSNASVTFTLPSSGPSGTFVGNGLTFTGTTNSQGLITTPSVTANSLNGSITVTATTAPNLSATFVLVIGNPQPLSVSPQLLIFYAEVGQPAPKAQFINVQAFPPQDLRIVVDVPWLKVSLQPNNILKDTLLVTVDHSALPPGHYDGNIIINEGAAIVRADLQVSPKPSIVPSARSLTFQYTQGQGIPSEQAVYITANSRQFNVTVTEVYVSPADATGWLKVAGDGSSTTPSPLHVTIAPGSLPPGTYTANIRITSPDATNSPFDIPVTMVISPASADQ